tara:strand:+ start:2394 stop:3200 length:807 start_codon:yes stop_codon:yes gene_type:complete
MKIIQITDPHLVPHKREMHGVNPFDRLSACIKDIELNHQDAKLCVISGDLSHKGQIESYKALGEILKGLSIPYRLMVGNHDIRKNLLSVFPDTPIDPNGFIQSCLDLGIGRFIFLDTVAEGEKFGCFCEDRAKWLADLLLTNRERPVYLFLHHPPLEIGLPNMDRMRLIYGDELLARTLEPCKNVKHMFFGHVHRPTAGNWNGISFSSIRGTAHQVALKMTQTPILVRSHEPPAYGIIYINKHSSIVHFHDFLDNTAFISNADPTFQP